MIDHYISKPHVKKRMLRSPLGVMFEDYVLSLHQKGYHRLTILNYCLVLEHFGQWIFKKSLPLKKISQCSIDDFLKKHLLHCRCPMPHTKNIKAIRAALKLLVVLLRNKNIILSVNNKKENFIEYFIKEYDDYLVNVCGVSRNTRLYRRRYVYKFLTTFHLNSFLKITTIGPKEIYHFIMKDYQKYKSNSLRVVTSH